MMMNKPALSLLFALCFANSPSAMALEAVLPEHLQQIEALQRRAENLAFGETGPDNYHLAKARAWLDLALSEYHEKDTSGALSETIKQAQTLLDALEQKQPGITMDTPVQITGSEAIRPDLLDAIATLKRHDKFACGQRPLATAEVYLMWAGHEYFESGESHSQSYVRSVENLVYDAQVAIDNCVSAPAAAPEIPPLEKITLSGDALFTFDKATLNPDALWRLDKVVANIRNIPQLEEVVLVGHTDRMRSDGRQERNQILSEQRAESIRQYLIGKGIPADKIKASGAGSSQPIVQCSTKQSKARQIACLQPNRRVEITLRGAKAESRAQPQGEIKPPAAAGESK